MLSSPIFLSFCAEQICSASDEQREKGRAVASGDRPSVPSRSTGLRPPLALERRLKFDLEPELILRFSLPPRRSSLVRVAAASFSFGRSSLISPSVGEAICPSLSQETCDTKKGRKACRYLREKEGAIGSGSGGGRRERGEARERDASTSGGGDRVSG